MRWKCWRVENSRTRSGQLVVLCVEMRLKQTKQKNRFDCRTDSEIKFNIMSYVDEMNEIALLSIILEEMTELTNEFIIFYTLEISGCISNSNVC